MTNAIGIGLGQQRLHRGLAAVCQGDVQLGVARVFEQGLFQLRDARLVLALPHQLVAVLAYRIGSAAGNGHAQRHEQERGRFAQR